MRRYYIENKEKKTEIIRILKNAVFALIIIVGCAPSLDVKTDKIPHTPLKKEYISGRIKIYDIRPKREKAYYWFYGTPLANKSTIVSGGFYPGEKDILKLGKKIEAILDSLSENKSQADIEILHYYVRVVPDKELYRLENASAIIGLGGLAFLVWNGVRVAKDINAEQELLDKIFLWAFFPIIILVPTDIISSTADVLLGISMIENMSAIFKKREVEGILKIRIKTNGKQSIVKGKYREKIFLDKHKDTKRISSEHYGWRIKEEYLRKILQKTEEKFFAELRKKKF